MKKLLIVLTMIALCSCQTNNAFKNYRNNPFQYPYPEYYLKANVIKIQKTPGKNDPTIIDTGIHKIIFNTGPDTTITIVNKHNSFYLETNDDLFGVLTFEKENHMGCSEETKEKEKDFCSAFKSSKEYYMKLFTLTPETLSEKKYAAMGNKWIVHNKGSWFKDVKNIMIYKNDEITAFRRDFKASADRKTKTELIIFHKMLSPDYLGIALTVSNDKIIERILSTIEIQY